MQPLSSPHTGIDQTVVCASEREEGVGALEPGLQLADSSTPWRWPAATMATPSKEFPSLLFTPRPVDGKDKDYRTPFTTQRSPSAVPVSGALFRTPSNAREGEVAAHDRSATSARGCPLLCLSQPQTSLYRNFQYCTADGIHSPCLAEAHQLAWELTAFMQHACCPTRRPG